MADEEVQAAMRTRRAEALRRVMDTAAELRRAAEALENAASGDLDWIVLLADQPGRDRPLDALDAGGVRRLHGAASNASTALVELARFEVHR